MNWISNHILATCKYLANYISSCCPPFRHTVSNSVDQNIIVKSTILATFTLLLCLHRFQRLQPEISKFVMMLKVRLKKFKDDGRKTLTTHQKNLPPLTEKQRIQIQFIHIWNIFKLIQRDAYEICKYHTEYRSSHERLQIFMGRFGQFSNQLSIFVFHVGDFSF